MDLGQGLHLDLFTLTIFLKAHLLPGHRKDNVIKLSEGMIIGHWITQSYDRIHFQECCPVKGNIYPISLPAEFVVVSQSSFKIVVSLAMGETRNFDELLNDIGPFGWFQIRIYAFKMMTAFIAAGPVMGIVFLAAIPNHWCAIPTLDRLNISQEARWNISIPLEERDGRIVHSQCKMYDRDYSNLTEKDVQYLLTYGNLSEVPVRECKNGWLFDQSQYESTITGDVGITEEKKSRKDV